MLKKIIIAASLSCAFSVSFANNFLTADVHQPTIMHDNYGADIHYPCSGGGEPLVIYSTDVGNRQAISSKNIIEPVYIKEGYTATPLKISDNEQTDLTSFKNLIVQTTNPAFDTVKFQLSRTDGQPFYVDTANYPALALPKNSNGVLVKYVSAYRVYADDDLLTPFKATFRPIQDYWFVQDVGLFIYHAVTKIQVEAASWNQNGMWSDGELGRHLYNVRYKFAPEQMPGITPAAYNGYGFWVCGGVENGTTQSQSSELVYQDKIVTS